MTTKLPPRRPQSERRHFVFVRACGCPLGLAEQTPRCRDEDAAWRAMYDTRMAERSAAAAGVRVELVDHATYEERFYPLMTIDCPHLGGAA